MATKESNPGITCQVLNLIAIIVLVIVEVFFLIIFIKFRSNEVGDMAEGFLAMCGLCMIVPTFAIYLLVCCIITLVKRDIYGEKHASAILFGFILQIVGILILGVGWVVFPNLFDTDLVIPLWMGIPFIPIAWGWFLELKEVGGGKFGLVGTLVYTFGKIIFIIGTIMVISPGTEETYQSNLFIPIIGEVVALCALGLLLVGEIQSIGWMKEHPPLIDTQQRAIMQGQQQQLMMQQQLLDIQQQQLIATQQLQAQLVGGGAPPQIPQASPIVGPGKKNCVSCGQQVKTKYKICPFCDQPT